MAVMKKVELQDHEGNIIHPHTETSVVFMNDGKTLDEAMKEDVTEEEIRVIIEEED